MFDVIVVGGGPAGTVAALRARELGASVALVERGHLGGSCINDGCVPMRALARAARMARDALQFEAYGLLGPAPVVDFGRLVARARQTVENVHANKQLVENLRRSGVALFEAAGPARFVGERTLVLGDGVSLQADKFIICVGGHARQLDFPGCENVLSLKDLWSLERLPASAVVVGGSATGCQLASVLAALGTKITLLEAGPRLLAANDELLGRELTTAFRERGMDIVTDIDALERATRTPNGLVLVYRNHDGPHFLETEALFLAVGWPANTAGLGLDTAGVATNERGFIWVDQRLQTSVPHIYAAGDVTGLTMLVQSADHQARLAAENAVLGSDCTFVHRVIPFGGFTDPEYAGVGLTEEGARAEEDSVTAEVTYQELDRAVIDGRTRGSLKLIVSRKTRRVLGAHVVGEQALEVVQIVAATMKMGGRVEDLARLKIAYPTFAAIVGVAARRLARELGVVPVAAYWRDLRESLVADWEGSDRIGSSVKDARTQPV